MKIEPPFPRRFYASPIPNFEKFDPCRGIEGYCAAIRKFLIKPGDYFLFSYFTLNKDTHFTYAANDGSRFSQVLSSLFATQDERFYEVIRRVYNDYCNYKAHHGIAYDSVKVQRNQQDATWGTIDSVTNLAMTEDKFPAARLHAGWLARCDEHYRPCYEQMLLPIATKKRQLLSVPYFDNESIFLSAHQKVMKKIQQLRKKTETLIQREDYEDINTAPFRLLTQQGYI